MSETVTELRSGACLCGAVRYTVTGPVRDVVACHCTQCRRQTGHYWATATAPRGAVRTEGAENLRWYAASDKARRGFCAACGSVLFWEPTGEERLSFSAGSLDGATGLKIARHIYVADKGDYYTIDDGAPQFPDGSG